MASEQKKATSNEKRETEHAQLMEQVQQLSIMRESNLVLREQSEKAAQRVAQLEEELEALNSKMQPMNEGRQQLAVQLSVANEEKTALTTELNYWKARVQKLLVRRDR